MLGHNHNERSYCELGRELRDLREALERQQPGLSKGYKAFHDQYSAFLESYLQFLGTCQTEPNSPLGAPRWER